MNPDILAKYAKNRLVVTRQVKFAPDEDKSLDMVLFLNVSWRRTRYAVMFELRSGRRTDQRSPSARPIRR
jgi:hypothetical protein